MNQMMDEINSILCFNQNYTKKIHIHIYIQPRGDSRSSQRGLSQVLVRIPRNKEALLVDKIG